MATFDRFDICLAHEALENDWNHGGWLRERPANQRRKEATSIQLQRLGFVARRGGSFQALLDGGDEMANAREIYVERLVDFGLAGLVDPGDELGTHIRRTYARAWVARHLPQLAAA